MGLSVVVLAAGQGKRFKSAVPKPLQSLAGKPLLWHVLAAAAPLGAGHTMVVASPDAEQAITALVGAATGGRVSVAVQAEPRGTGDAAAVALPLLPATGEVLVLYGDTPLVTTGTLEALVEAHRSSGATATLLSCGVDDPTGYGRVVRNSDGGVARVVEHRDATAEEREIREVNAGMYVFDRAALEALGELGSDNDQGERYLPDVLALILERGGHVHASAGPAADTQGVNDRAELAAAGALLRSRILRRLLDEGVGIADPATTYVDVDVEVGADTMLLPLTFLEGGTRVGEGCTIGPNARLTRTSVGDRATVTQAVAIDAVIGDDASVGPFAYLRPGAELGPGTKVGSYVEVKGSRLGRGSKVPHLTYVGDAEIGEDVNVGAGTVFVNYDGVAKHRTTVGDGAFVGSGTMLVAPVEIGAGALTAAGSTITREVPADAIAIERADQRVIEGAAARRRRRLGAGEHSAPHSTPPEASGPATSGPAAERGGHQ